MTKRKVEDLDASYDVVVDDFSFEISYYLTILF